MCKKITVTTTYVTDATLNDTRSIPINKQAGENSELGISESNITNFPKLTYNYKQRPDVSTETHEMYTNPPTNVGEKQYLDNKNTLIIILIIIIIILYVATVLTFTFPSIYTIFRTYRPLNI
jgi:hypothetical protein